MAEAHALTKPGLTAEKAMAMVDQARGLLATAKTFAERRSVKDLAGAAKIFLKGQKDARAAAVEAGNIEILATRLLGAALREQQKHPGGRPPKTGVKFTPVSEPATLEQLGVSKNEARQWERLADVPEPEVAAYVEKCRAEHRVPTVHGAAPAIQRSAFKAQREAERKAEATREYQQQAEQNKRDWAAEQKSIPARARHIEGRLNAQRQQRAMGPAVCCQLRLLCESLTVMPRLLMEAAREDANTGVYTSEEKQAIKKSIADVHAAIATLAPNLDRELQHNVDERHHPLFSAIIPAVARAREYRSVRKGLEIPIWDIKGEKRWVQTRVDKPRDSRHRFINGSGDSPIVDVSPYGRDWVRDREKILYVAEAPRKADALVSRGVACVACQGVAHVSFDRDDWNEIGVKDRRVVLVFDADASCNANVLAAEGALFECLSGLALLPESFPSIEFREMASPWPKKSPKSHQRLDSSSSSTASALT